MPTILTHAVVPIAIGLGLGSAIAPRRLLLARAVAAMLPDLDVVAFKLGIAYGDAAGHRGASHSLAFALLIGLIALMFARALHTTRTRAFAFAGLATLSHPLLDMFTNGGLDVALWWPWSAARVFAPWQVIEVSPIGISRFFTARGMQVLASEFMWVWLPAIALKSALRLMSRSGWARLSGGQTSLRLARSYQPAVDATRAANVPLRSNSLRKSMRLASADSPALSIVTMISSSRSISRKYSTTSFLTTGPSCSLANSGIGKPASAKYIMRTSAALSR